MHPHPAMDGLKLSPRNWNTHLQNFIVSIGVRRGQLAACKLGSSTHIYILLALTTEDMTVHVKSSLHIQFCIKEMGPASEFLNVKITHRPGMLMIVQQLYCLSCPYSCIHNNHNHSPPLQNGEASCLVT